MSHPYKTLVDETLAKFGGLYTFEDIYEAVMVGDMQSFSEGDSWAVTQIGVFPRRRVLDILFAVGKLEELMKVEEKIVNFAREQGIDMIMANGRRGFEMFMLQGWKMVSSTYVKDMSDGS